MIRFAILFIYLIFSSTSLMGQEVTLSESVTLRNEIAYYLIGKIKGKHLVLRERPGKFLLNAFNEDMTMGWERELELPKKRPEIVEIFDLEDRFYILFVHRDKGGAKLTIHKYDGGANLVDSTLVKNLGSQFVLPDFNIIQSENRKVLQIEENNASESRELTVFNLEEMKVLYDVSFNPSNFNSNADYNKLLIDNEGTSYYVIERDNRRSKKNNHRFEVIGYESYSNRQFKFVMRVGSRLSYDVDVSIDNLNHTLIAGGYYTEKAYGKASGTFYMRVPLGDPQSVTINFNPFEEILLETVQGKSKRSKKYLSEIRVKELIARRDGGVLIVGEKFKRLDGRIPAGTEQGNQFAGFAPFSSDYYFDDIFIVTHHPDGEHHWTNFFYKRQYSKNDSGIYSSYFVMKTPSQLRFLFNDEIIQNTTVSTYNVMPDGSYDRKALLNANFQNIRLRFISSKQISSNEVIVPSEFKGELRLLKVLFNPQAL